MGIFIGKEKRLRAEEKVTSALEKNPILDYFKNQICNLDDDYQWVFSTNDYYDDRFRTVVIGDDYIVIHKCHVGNLTAKKPEDVPSIGLKYTDLGYMPITSYKGDGVTLYKEEVLRLWGDLIQQAMRSISPKCTFQELLDLYIQGSFECIYFEYTIPEYPWKSWF